MQNSTPQRHIVIGFSVTKKKKNCLQYSPHHTNSIPAKQSPPQNQLLSPFRFLQQSNRLHTSAEHIRTGKN